MGVVEEDVEEEDDDDDGHPLLVPLLYESHPHLLLNEFKLLLWVG